MQCTFKAFLRYQFLTSLDTGLPGMKPPVAPGDSALTPPPLESLMEAGGTGPRSLALFTVGGTVLLCKDMQHQVEVHVANAFVARSIKKYVLTYTC